MTDLANSDIGFYATYLAVLGNGLYRSYSIMNLNKYEAANNKGRLPTKLEKQKEFFVDLKEVFHFLLITNRTEKY